MPGWDPTTRQCICLMPCPTLLLLQLLLLLLLLLLLPCTVPSLRQAARRRSRTSRAVQAARCASASSLSKMAHCSVNVRSWGHRLRGHWWGVGGHKQLGVG